MSPKAQPVLTLQDKFAEIKKSMKGVLLERDPVIDCLILAAVARTNIFLLGPPGVAKSYAIRTFREHIDGLTDEEYFEILMMRQTTREEVFGPLSLTLLKQDRYVFKEEGYLPTAKFGFLDEIWKANSAILNALLWATNERLFRNDGKVHDIPLWTLACASNELPEGEELNAIYDRIPFRLLVEEIVEPANFEKMLKLATAPAKVTPKLITWAEIEQAHADAMNVVLGQEVFDALNEVRADLGGENIRPTARRFNTALKIIKAAAWLDGETEADIEHIRPLMHILWDDPKDFPLVEKKMLELANPFDKEAMDLLHGIRKIGDELDKALKDTTMDPDVLSRKGVELHSRVEEARNDLNKLDAEMKASNSKRKSAKFQECKAALLTVTRRLLKNMFDATDEELDEAAMVGGSDD